jgi:hypothetical protein
MKFEALGPIKAAGYVLDAGDVKVNLPDDIGAAWCARGWGRDLDGIVPTGERVVLDGRLSIHPTVFSVSAPDAGVN